MTPNVIADFNAKFATNVRNNTEINLQKCRVIMNKRQIIIATNEDKLKIQIKDIIDILKSNIPQRHKALFDETITLAHQTNDGVKTILIEDDEETINKFKEFVYKLTIGNVPVLIKHPARVGGRVTDEKPRQGTIKLRDGSILFKTQTGKNFKIDINSVIHFKRSKRSPDGQKRPTILVKHVGNGDDIMTTLVATKSRDKLNLIGRYMKSEYSDLKKEVDEINLSNEEKELLVSIYMTGGDIDYTNVLSGNTTHVQNVIKRLENKNLIKQGTSKTELTSIGKIVVTENIEDVNF